MRNPFRKKPTVTVEETRRLICSLGLDEKSVFGEEIWPSIKPGNYSQCEHRMHFEDVIVRISPIEEDTFELRTLGVLVDFPYGTHKSYKTHFDYKTTIPI